MRVAGLGFRKGTAVESLRAVLAKVGPFDAIATAATKVDDPGFASLVKELCLPLHAVSQEALAASERAGSGQAKALYGTGSVAESAALAAAGPGARLVVPRVKGPDGKAVAAVAERT